MVENKPSLPKFPPKGPRVLLMQGGPGESQRPGMLVAPLAEKYPPTLVLWIPVLVMLE